MNSRIKLITVVCLVVLALSLIAANNTQVMAPFFKVFGKLEVGEEIKVGTRITLVDSLMKFGSTYGFRDSSGVIQFRGSADSKWRVLSDTVGGTGDEVTITKDAGTGELSFKAPYKAYVDTSNALWMGFTSNNPMLYDGMRNQMFYGNRVAIYDSAGYDKIIHYAKANATERFTIVLTDTIFHRGVNDTIPSNIYLYSQDRAGIWMNEDDILYFDCRLDAGRYQVFYNGFQLKFIAASASGDFTFGRQKVWKPEWFGGLGMPTEATAKTNQKTEAIQRAFLAAFRTYRGTVLFEDGVYYSGDSLWVPQGVSWTVENDGFSYFILASNPADTAIWFGGTKWPWIYDATPLWGFTATTYGVGAMTEAKVGNIYIKGTRSAVLASHEDVLVYIKRPALGARFENTQIWSSYNKGVFVYIPNIGPYLANVWIENHYGTGLHIHEGAGLEAYCLHLETNASVSGYHLHVTGNYNNFHSLHIETNVSDNDTIMYFDTASHNYISYLYTYITCDSVTLIAGGGCDVNKVIHYSMPTTQDSSKLYYYTSSSIPRSLPWSQTNMPVTGGKGGVGPIWNINIGGSSDINVMPGDTIPNWAGFLGLFSRRSNQTSLGGYYSTYSLDPPFYLNKNGSVWPLLPAVPLTGNDTTAATNYTGDTNTADSLATTSAALEDLKNKYDKLWRKFKLMEQD